MAAISYSRSSAVASSYKTLCGKGVLSAQLLHTGNDVAGFSGAALGLLGGREVAVCPIASFRSTSAKIKAE